MLTVNTRGVQAGECHRVVYLPTESLTVGNTALQGRQVFAPAPQARVAGSIPQEKHVGAHHCSCSRGVCGMLLCCSGRGLSCVLQHASASCLCLMSESSVMRGVVWALSGPTHLHLAACHMRTVAKVRKQFDIYLLQHMG